MYVVALGVAVHTLVLVRQDVCHSPFREIQIRALDPSGASLGSAFPANSKARAIHGSVLLDTVDFV